MDTLLFCLPFVSLSVSPIVLSFVHILFINWGPPVGPKPKIVSTFVLHEVPTSAAAGTGLKGNAVQNRDYARSCESPFSRPHILRHCPAGREGVRQGRVRRPASAATPSAFRDVRVRRQHFFRNLFVTMTAFGLCAGKQGLFAPCRIVRRKNFTD